MRFPYSSKFAATLALILVSITMMCHHPGQAFTATIHLPSQRNSHGDAFKISLFRVDWSHDGSKPFGLQQQHASRRHTLARPRANMPWTPQTRLFTQPQSSQEGKMISVERRKVDDDVEEKGTLHYAKFTAGLVMGQSLLILLAVLSAAVLKTPNYGLGPAIDLSSTSLGLGVLWTVPLGVISFVLDRVEDDFPALQKVSRASNQVALTMLGPSFKPILALVASCALGLAAGIGEEMLFRGVVQYELGNRFMNDIAAVGVTSVVFGALHALTPLYAVLAGLASLFFGWLYLVTGNLAVPMACHAFWDVVALMYAHWTVTHMTKAEQQALLRQSE